MQALRRDIAQQAAFLLNTQNKLTEYYETDSIRYGDGYIVKTNGRSVLFGVVRILRVQWYQAELSHLSIAPAFQGFGFGAALIKEAEEQALELHAKVVQCVLRVDNLASENLFKKCGYIPGAMFLNKSSGNILRIYQKTIWGDM